jgi:serine/threonine protein kinase
VPHENRAWARGSGDFGMAEETGKRIGDYEILGVLGAGGMGQVFKVRNVISDRIEAMKILLPDLAGRQDLADRFLREIKVLAALDHPNIAALRTALTLGNQLVMVMEFVEGTSLATRLERGPVAPADALDYVDQVLAALSYAHQRQVIHRDIKPANMMLTPENVVKLMDFGIARTGTDRTLTATGTTMGSLYYMSPEQVKGGSTDARSDLYSLGVTLYEMVTGQRPFRADSDYSLMAAQVQQQPTPPIELRADLPAALNEIILLSMAKEPAQRFQSADAFRKALGSVRGEFQKAGVARTASAVPIATALFQGPTARGTPMHDLPTASAQTPVQPEIPPQPIPSVLELSARPRTHRGLYMTLGALIVLAVLVVAGIYVPRHSKTRADEAAQQAAANQSAASNNAAGSGTSASNGAKTTDSTTPQDSTVPPSASPSPDSAAGSPSNPPSDSSSNAGANDSSATGSAGAAPPAAPSSAKQAKKARNGNGSTSSAGSASQDSGEAQGGDATAQSSQTSRAEQLEQVEKEVDQLSGRTGAVNDSLDNLRREQSAQGFGLRGDMASTQESLKIHMAKAQQALQNQDVKSAQRYLNLAEPEVEKLEKFLGH